MLKLIEIQNDIINLEIYSMLKLNLKILSINFLIFIFLFSTANSNSLIEGEEIKNNMPDIISEKLIKPILKNNNLAVNQVQDWSLHQGGLPILQSFTDEKNLNLTNEQIRRSKQMFQKHGNLSSPSAFVVLESFFQQPSTNSSYGIIASLVLGIIWVRFFIGVNLGIYS